MPFELLGVSYPCRSCSAEASCNAVVILAQRNHPVLPQCNSTGVALPGSLWYQLPLDDGRRGSKQ